MFVRDLLIRLGFKLDDDKLESVDRMLKEIKRDARGASREVDSLSKTLRNGLLGGAVTAGLALFGRELVKTTSETQKLGAQLETIEGSAEKADAAFTMLKTFARTTPFELGNVVSAYTKLRAVGLKPTIEDMTAFGDTAAGMGGDIKEFSEAVVGATTGEMDRLKQFGIVAKQQGKKVTFIFKGQKKTIKKDAGAIFGYLSELGKANFAGGMGRQMATIGGAFSNLKDNISAFMNQIGAAGFNKELTLFIKELTGIAGEGEDVAYVIGTVLARALKTAREALKWARENAGMLRKTLMLLTTGAVLFGLGKLAMAVGGVTKAMVLMKVAALRAAAAQLLMGAQAALVVIAFLLIAAAIEDIFGFFNGKESVVGIWLEDMGYKGEEAFDVLEKGLYATAIGLGVLLMAFNPVLGLLAVLATQIVWLYTNAEKIGPAFRRFGEETWQFFKKLTLLILAEFKSWIVGLGEAIGETAASLWIPISDFFENMVARVQASWDGLIAYIMGKIREVIGVARRAADIMSDPLKLGKELASGALTVEAMTSKVFGEGASSPALDTQRRVAQISGARGGPRFTISSPITINGGAMAAAGEATIEVEAEFRRMFDRVVSDAASDLEGGTD